MLGAIALVDRLWCREKDDVLFGVLREMGLAVGNEVEVRVWDSTAELRYLVVPEQPANTSGWDEDRLAAIVTRDSMIGTRLAMASE